MLKVPYFKQDTDYTCGPTALQMVLAYYGVRDSEQDLAKKLHTTSEEGTTTVAMYELALKLGFHCYISNESTISEIDFMLDLKIPPIVRYLDRETNIDHYGVVVGSSENYLMIHDPWSGPDRRFDRDHFKERWFCDVLGNCDRWLLAISPEPVPVGRQLHPHNNRDKN